MTHTEIILSGAPIQLSAVSRLKRDPQVFISLPSSDPSASFTLPVDQVLLVWTGQLVGAGQSQSSV